VALNSVCFTSCFWIVFLSVDSVCV
jgi:hypothetical protein